jgi:hypothetical protein
MGELAPKSYKSKRIWDVAPERRFVFHYTDVTAARAIVATRTVRVSSRHPRRPGFYVCGYAPGGAVTFESHICAIVAFMVESAATPIDHSGPELRGTRQGYFLGDQVIDGFSDQPQLPPFHRRLIAEWAKAFGYDLSAAQQKLLRTRPTPPEAQLEILRAAQCNGDHDVPRLVESGVYETLSADDVERCEYPQEILGEDRSYPINATELATLAGVTYKQVRDWDKNGLLPSHDVDGRRQYFSAAALTACALKPLDKWQIAALRGVLGVDRDSGFRRLIDYVSA